MRKTARIALVLLGAAALPALGTSARAQTVAVRGEVVHTLEGPPLEDGIVLVRDGKIAAVGPASAVAVPEGVRTLTAKVVVPGLIDAHSVVGLAGQLNTAHDQDQLEASAPLQPELRAIDAYDPREPLIAWIRSFGVTTIHTGHAPGAVISGQTLIAKTRGDTLDEAVLVPRAMIAATLGDSVLREGKESPGTRAKAAALLRSALVQAQEYAAKRVADDEEKRPARDLRLEALADLLEKKLPLLVTAHRSHDILTALRIAEEFGLELVLDGVADAPLVLERLKAANRPILVHPTMARATGERKNLSLETAAALRHAGLRVALQSGYESYVPRTRVVLFEAAIAAANGLSFEEALGLVTLDAARILGIDARVGSLAVGKDGDLALYDGDPFECTTHCTGVVIDGVVASEERR